jgi:D-glycero-alpha-D-manno-heptose-7-phosphate kinase
MIISRTPLRVSFSGGGTDLEDFYLVEPGAVVSTAIKKYIYITVSQRFDNSIRVSYSKTEIVSRVDDIQHPIVREALKMVGIDSGIDIVSISDIPAGTGLGSSSSFTVGLLNALYAYKGCFKTAEELAKDACRLEIDILGEPIGKQDQYIAAYGGLCYIQFNPDKSVFVNPLIPKKQVKELLEKRLLMCYIGNLRNARTILSEQKANTKNDDKFLNLKKMRDFALTARECLLDGFNPNEFGQILHKGWLLKKELAGGISGTFIDQCYEKALNAGALGGKLLGAGGGGFLLLFCLPENMPAVKQALGDLRIFNVSLEPEGSKIVYSA